MYLKENPDLCLFDSCKDMRKIINLIIDKHKVEYGMSLCSKCHNKIHRLEKYKISVYNIFRDGDVNCKKYQREDKNYVKCKNYKIIGGNCICPDSYDSLCIELYNFWLNDYKLLIYTKE